MFKFLLHIQVPTFKIACIKYNIDFKLKIKFTTLKDTKTNIFLVGTYLS